MGDNTTYVREAIKPRTERNGTELEVIDAQYGCGRQIRDVLICQLISVRRAHLASCTSHEDRTSTQQTVQSHTKRIKHSIHLPGIFIWHDIL